MKTLTRTLIVSLTLLAASMTACVEESDPKETLEPACQQASCEPETETETETETARALLKGTYISAHLGTYTSCPEDGYVPGAGLTPEPDEERSGDQAQGACFAEDECAPIMNCEDGQFSLRLSNSGDADASGIIITQLELFKGSGGSVGTLPIADVINVETGQAFDGTLAADETVNLRIDFMGPASPYDMLEQEHTGHLEATVAADDHEDFKIEGQDIAALPDVAT